MNMMPVTDKFVHLQSLTQQFEELRSYIHTSAQSVVAVHQVEQELWRRLLQLGYQALGMFFALQGNGDLGENLTLPDGQIVKRLSTTHQCDYQSVFGLFRLNRIVYGSREGQKIEFVPLDARLQLPDSKFSYLLQDWDQSLSVESPYSKVNEILKKILGFEQSTDSLERMNRQMATVVESFRETKLAPRAAAEGQLIVASADGKGIPIRRNADSPPILDHRHKSGPKPDRKKMAIVGTVYSIDPVIRTPTEVVESLFRDPRQQDQKKPHEHPRPQPQHKELRARLTTEQNGEVVNATKTSFDWIAVQTKKRNPNADKIFVTIMDGQESLWDAATKTLSQPNRIDILDLLHVTPRLWTTAYQFFPQDSDDAIAFVKDHVRLILQGKVNDVIASWQKMARRTPSQRSETGDSEKSNTLL